MSNKNSALSLERKGRANLVAKTFVATGVASTGETASRVGAQASKYSATQFQNQALRQGFKDSGSATGGAQAGAGDEQNPSRNKRRVYSKESNKIQMPLLQREASDLGGQQYPADTTDPNEVID